jgi:malonyl-CoA/methylmalonyl-CoA synthetase
VSGGLPALFAARSTDPQAPFLRAGGRRTMTYGQLWARVEALRAALVSFGVRKGDRVAFQVEKSAAVFPLHLALLAAGAVQLPLNPTYPDAEVRALLADAEPSLVVRDPRREVVEGPWVTATMDMHGEGSLAEAVGQGSPPKAPELDAADGAALLYTSGTTGRPKGAYLTHGNLQHNAESLVDAWGFTPDDVLLHILPLFHTHGLFVATHCVLASGASMVVQPGFDVTAVLEELPRCTVVMGVPTHYTRLLSDSRFDHDAVRGLRLMVSGSAPMSATLHQQVRQRTGLSVVERYGMTETSMLTSNPLDGDRRPGRVGTPLRGVGLRVVDESDQPVAEGDVGAVQVKGPNVFGGYWRRPDLDGDTFTVDGWFRTGDLGRVDGDGSLELVGRSKDLIISGGLNVYPKDVESVLDRTAGIVESAVVGVPDADLGERVVAAVVVEQGAVVDPQDLRRSLRERLAPYQVPKHVTVLETLPRNAMGKVEKTVLRTLLAGRAP